MLWNYLKYHLDWFETRLRDRRGNIVWYLAAGVGGIVVFYIVFFLFWTEIKRWFVQGK